MLTLQSLCEFVAATTRKGKLSLAQADEQVEDWKILFPVVAAVPDNLGQAIRAVEEHNLSFWDALLWSVANQAAVELLLSEDLQHGRLLGGVRFCNPFEIDDPFGFLDQEPPADTDG